MTKTLVRSIFIFLIMVFSISVSAQLSGDIISTTQKQGNMTYGISIHYDLEVEFKVMDDEFHTEGMASEIFNAEYPYNLISSFVTTVGDDGSSSYEIRINSWLPGRPLQKTRQTRRQDQNHFYKYICNN